MKTTFRHARRAAMLPALLLPCALMHAQSATSPAAPATTPDSEETIMLSPFEVSSSATDNSYTAPSTLAGNRLNTDLRDVGSSVSVITSQFLRDTGATDNTTLLQRVGGAEVGGKYGNFAGSGSASSISVLAEDTIRPSENTRIRGLAAADNTRDFFRSEIPWDSYNTDRIDIQRGPNSILFGQGSPAGIINSSSAAASFHNSGNLELRFGSYGSTRGSLDWNQVLVDKQVAIRIDALADDVKYEQKPAYSKDKRISGAIRIQPEFLSKNGNQTIFKANFENGQINSNNPRELPPTDHITPWFTALNQEGLNGNLAWIPAGQNTSTAAALGTPTPTDTANGILPGTSAARPNFDPNKPAYNPYFTNGQFLNDNFPLTVFQNGAQTGTGGTYRFPYQTQPGTPGDYVLPYGAFPTSWVAIGGAAQTNVFEVRPYYNGGAFKDTSLTDPSVFNFYKNLIDGNTKREWQRFWQGSVNLTQTFLNDQVGFSADYHKEHYENGQVNPLGGAVPLYVDVMSTNNDGTSLATASKNPGFGTPFVVVNPNNSANTSWSSDRENKRLTGFVTRDFRKDIPGVLGQIIGTQTLTGLLGDDSQKTESTAWENYGYVGSQLSLVKNLYTGTNQTDPSTTFKDEEPYQIIYLGDSLVGKSLDSANIPRITGNPVIGSSAINYYSFTPTATPGQYTGWTNSTSVPTVTNADNSLADRRALTYYAGLTRSETTSQGLVWQGKMLDGALVGTYGWRRDINKGWFDNANLRDANDPQGINFDALALPSDPNSRIEVQSHSWSVVAHLGDLPGIKNFAQKLPVNISLSYNISTNFEPDSTRVNINGDSIAAPKGKTVDRGIVIETRDGKYSLKVNRYETTITNGSNPNGASFASQLSQFVGQTAFFNNEFYYHTTDGTATSTPEAAPDPVTGLGGSPGGYFYNYLPDGTIIHDPAIAATQTNSVAAVRAWEAKVNADIPNFFKQWGYTSLAAVQSGSLGSSLKFEPQEANFAIAENATSKGWEIELNANPVRNWRVTLNATRTDAVINSIGDPALAKFMQDTTNMVAGPGGAQHWYWGTSDVPTIAQTYFIAYGGSVPALGTYYYGLKSMEGVAVPELAKWRFNLTTNYDFTQSFLKGFNIGGGLRYTGHVVLGYPPGGDPSGPPPFSPDLSKPYYGPSELYVDLWVGYQRKLTNKINWSIQLNAQNVGKGDYLIPVSLQGPIDGVSSPAAYRIGPSQVFTLTNRFEF